MSVANQVFGNLKSRIAQSPRNINVSDFKSRNNGSIISNFTRPIPEMEDNLATNNSNIEEYLNVEDPKELSEFDSSIAEEPSPDVKKHNLFEVNPQFSMVVSNTYTDLKKIFDKIIDLSANPLGNKRKIFDLYNYVDELFENHSNPIMTIATKKVRVEILIEFRDYASPLQSGQLNNECVIVLHRLIDFCEKHKKYRELMSVLCQLGIVYRLQKKFMLSIQFHILQLELAWEQKDFTHEMKAYEYIAMSYYYLGNIPMATYYMQRINQGKYEPDNSVQKRIAFTMIKNHREKLKLQGYQHIIDEYERSTRRNDFRLSNMDQPVKVAQPGTTKRSRRNNDFNKVNDKNFENNSLNKSDKILSASMDFRSTSNKRNRIFP